MTAHSPPAWATSATQRLAVARGGSRCGALQPTILEGRWSADLLAEQRDTGAARRFFTRALRWPAPVEVTTDKAGPYLRVLDELVQAALHVTDQYANNRVEADRGRLKARLRPMRGLKQVRSAAQITAGHAFVQNLAAATTNSPPKPHRDSVWPPHSPSSR